MLVRQDKFQGQIWKITFYIYIALANWRTIYYNCLCLHSHTVSFQVLLINKTNCFRAQNLYCNCFCLSSTLERRSRNCLIVCSCIIYSGTEVLNKLLACHKFWVIIIFPFTQRIQWFNFYFYNLVTRGAWQCTVITKYAGRLSHMNSVKWPCSPWVLVAQWIERPPCVREVMGSIPVGDSDISLSHARVMLINSSFTRNNTFITTGYYRKTEWLKSKLRTTSCSIHR